MRGNQASRDGLPYVVQFYLFKSHQQVLVSSMEIPETTELDRRATDWGGGGKGTRDPS